MFKYNVECRALIKLSALIAIIFHDPETQYVTCLCTPINSTIATQNVCMNFKLFLDYKHGEVRGGGEQRCVKQMCVTVGREEGGGDV